MPVNKLHQLIASNDPSKVVEKVNEVNNQLKELGQIMEKGVAAQQQSSTSLGEFVGEFQKIAPKLINVISRTPQPIPLEDAGEDCIQESFTFMRSLNEIESLVTDSKFNESKKKKNSETLAGMQNTALYKGCIAILDQKMLNAQLADDEGNRFKEEFNALFVDIQDDLGDRAQRLIAIHQLRDRILHFFANQCRNVVLEESNNAPQSSTPAAT